jgi:hypothetical protein
MCGFYKSSYQKFLDNLEPSLIPNFDKKQGTSSITLAQMSKILELYTREVFGSELLDSVTFEERKQMGLSMLAFVYAHRHNKDDRFIKESRHLVDFSVVRDVQYAYSKKAQDKFFCHAAESYFLAKFAMSPEG